MGIGKKDAMPSAKDALPGRDKAIAVPDKHYVNGNPLAAPFPEGMELAVFGLGCFWGAERKFWQTEGVYSTAVGYAAGFTPNPTYREVCSGMTGHNEVVLVVFDPKVVSYEALLKVFLGRVITQLRECSKETTEVRSTVLAFILILMRRWKRQKGLKQCIRLR